MISVIVPAYNAVDTIEKCLRALLDQSYPRDDYEVIVVDDGSTDRTREIVGKYPVKLLSQPNQGPAVARNLGVENAEGDIILFTDSDCEPARDWIEQMVKPFQDEEIVGTKGVYKTRQRELVARFVQIEYEDRYDKMKHDKYIDFIDTYSAGYRKDVFLNCGGFDPVFTTASVEDQELSFKIASQGYKMVFVPQAIVYHRHAYTLERYLRKKFWIGYWKYLVLKRYPQKVVKDSHTPQILKAQVGLFYLILLGFFASIFYNPLIYPALFLLFTLLISTIPYSLKALRKDLIVGSLSPLLIFLRAGALGLGLGIGFITSKARIDRQVIHNDVG